MRGLNAAEREVLADADGFRGCEAETHQTHGADGYQDAADALLERGLIVAGVCQLDGAHPEITALGAFVRELDAAARGAA